MTRDGMQKLHIVCNGCGELMGQMGEWPITHPRELDAEGILKPVNTQQAFRYNCKTCRTPCLEYAPGYLW